MKYGFIVLFLSLGLCSACETLDSTYFERISGELNAKYTGGDKRFMSYIAENIDFPDSLCDDLDNEKILVEFEVDTFGTIGVKKTMGKKCGNGIEEEVIRLIESTSGCWESASQFGSKVSQNMRVPITVCVKERAYEKVRARDSVFSSFNVTLPATFTGGHDSLIQTIYQNLFWPKSMGLTCGTWVVYLRFVINIDGTISEIEVMKSSHISALDEATIFALLKTNGGWSPAYNEGVKVRMSFSIPITFSNIK